MIEIRLPQYGMGMSDGTILAWHKKVGDRVEQGERLCDVEAAKTTVEMESPIAGVLARIVVQAASNVPVNTVIAEFDDAPARNGSDGKMQASEASEASARILREEADVPPASGVVPGKASPLARRAAQQGGVDLAGMEGSGARGRIVLDDVQRAVRAATDTAERQVEPRARHLARALSFDIGGITGTGPGGRVVTEDVERAAAQALAKPAPAVAETAPAAPAAQLPEAPPYTESPHSMMRRTIARRLTESKQTVPHFYLRASCVIDALLKLRADINEGAVVKASVNDLVVRAVALALREVPDARVSWTDKAMRHHAEVDVAVAVATPRGLVTPIVRQADGKTIRQIAAEIKALAARAREGKLKPEEYTGGCVSVSNLGMYGVEEFSAILNPPQAAIFAIGAGEPRPVVRQGRVEVATMMNVTVSIDHRAVDGSVGAQMLAAFKRLIEAPARILA